MAGDGSFGEYAQVYNLETGGFRWGPFPSKPIHNAASVSSSGGIEQGFAMIGGEVVPGRGVEDIYEYDVGQDVFAKMEAVLGTPRTDLAAVDMTGLIECPAM